MPFEIVFDRAKDFTSIITGVSNLIDEAAFKITKEGISMRAMDPSRVVLVDLNLPAEIFSKYYIEEEETVGLNMEHFKKILKRAKSEDTLILRKGKDAFLKIIMQGIATRKFELPLIEVEELELDLPDLPFTAKAVILGEVLKEAVKDASLVNDYINGNIKFIAKENEFIIKAGGETREVEISLTLEEEGLLDIEIQKNTKSAYGVEYLSNIAKEIDRTKEVILRFGNDMPLQIDYLRMDEGKVTFLLAPRVED